MLNDSAYNQGILGGMMAQPRSFKEGVLGGMMAQPGSFRQGSLGGSTLMAQPGSFREGSLGACACHSKSMSGLGWLDTLDGTTKLLLGLGIGGAIVWYLKK